MKPARRIICLLGLALPAAAFGQFFNNNAIGPLLPTAAGLPAPAKSIQIGAGSVGTITSYAGTASVNYGGLKGQPQAVITGSASNGTNAIGSLYFQFAGFAGSRMFMGNPFATAGVLMRGGFNFGGYKSAPGYTLGWISQADTAFLGDNTDAFHMDGVVKDNPMYSQSGWIPDVNNPADATGRSKMSAGFFDAPSTPTNNMETAVSEADFETALVCFKTANFNPVAKMNAVTGPTTLDVISDFTWQYVPTNVDNVSTGIMSTEADGFNNVASTRFVQEFNSEFAKGGSMLSTPNTNFFTLDNTAGDCKECFQPASTPEPAGIVALAAMPLGTLVIPFIHRRRRRA